MTVREYVNQRLQSLDEAELAEVADYLAYLRFRARRYATPAVRCRPTVRFVCGSGGGRP